MRSGFTLPLSRDSSPVPILAAASASPGRSFLILGQRTLVLACALACSSPLPTASPAWPALSRALILRIQVGSLVWRCWGMSVPGEQGHASGARAYGEAAALRSSSCDDEDGGYSGFSRPPVLAGAAPGIAQVNPGVRTGPAEAGQDAVAAHDGARAACPPRALSKVTPSPAGTSSEPQTPPSWMETQVGTGHG